MSTRLITWVNKTKTEPRVKHFLGMPPELTGGQDYREKLGWPYILVIEDTSDGVFLFRYAKDGSPVGDTWHMNINDAKDQAKYEYDIPLTEWVVISPDIEDIVKFAFSIDSERTK